MALVDHFSLPCRASQLEAEIAFLTSAFACVGLHEVTRPINDVVGLGVKGSGKPVEDDGTNNVFLWVFSDKAPGGRELKDGDEVSGIHLALKMKNRKQVHEFYEAALKAGGKENGAPGERFYHAGYYAAFVKSPAGHNIEAVIRGPDQE